MPLKLSLLQHAIAANHQYEQKKNEDNH